MMTVLPVTSAAVTMPRKNGERKIPWRDDKGDAARPIMLIAFFAENVLGQARATEQPHLLRVEETEIDRFADIAISFRPCFADLVNFQRGKLVAPALHDRRDALEQLRAFFDTARGPPDECSFAATMARFRFRNSASCDWHRRLGRDGRIDGSDRVVGPDFLAVDDERIFLAERPCALPRARCASSPALCR